AFRRRLAGFTVAGSCELGSVFLDRATFWFSFICSVCCLFFSGLLENSWLDVVTNKKAVQSHQYSSAFFFRRRTADSRLAQPAGKSRPPSGREARTPPPPRPGINGAPAPCPPGALAPATSWLGTASGAAAGAPTAAGNVCDEGLPKGALC